MDLDLQAIVTNIRKAETDDLLDRVTVLRETMEPAAVDLIYAELARRGYSPEAIDEYGVGREPTVIRDDSGVTLTCQRCRRPAVTAKWRWHKVWGVIPLFPRWLATCEMHSTGSDRPQS